MPRLSGGSGEGAAVDLGRVLGDLPRQEPMHALRHGARRAQEAGARVGDGHLRRRRGEWVVEEVVVRSLFWCPLDVSE